MHWSDRLEQLKKKYPLEDLGYLKEAIDECMESEDSALDKVRTTRGLLSENERRLEE